jgi:hypothetical protein
MASAKGGSPVPAKGSVTTVTSRGYNSFRTFVTVPSVRVRAVRTVRTSMRLTRYVLI